MRQVTAAAFSWSLVFLAACAASAPTPTVQAPVHAPPPSSPPTIDCALTGSATGLYEGGCAVSCAVHALAINFDGIDAKRSCDGLPRIVQATLARTAVPGRWLGTMEGAKPEDPTRFEVVPGKGEGAIGVARTPYGRFAVRSLNASATGLRLRIDAARQVRPDADEPAIIDQRSR